MSTGIELIGKQHTHKNTQKNAFCQGVVPHLSNN